VALSCFVGRQVRFKYVRITARKWAGSVWLGQVAENPLRRRLAEGITELERRSGAAMSAMIRPTPAMKRKLLANRAVRLDLVVVI